MVEKIIGAQRDFSFGEVDVALKRADDHPARKAGLRQMANARILNTGGIQDRPGRRAVYPNPFCSRSEKLTMSAGNYFFIGFGPARLEIRNSSGVIVATFATQGGGAALPWATTDDINSIIYAVFNLSIYITFGHSMRPQVVTWDGLSTWTISDFTESLSGSQKRTPFYRISPQGITMLPGARTGSGVSLVSSSPVFVSGHVGTRMRYVGRQMLITAVGNSTNATVTIEESLPGHQNLGVSTDPRPSFSIGDAVIGGTSGSKGLITAISSTAIDVQLITTNTTVVNVGFVEQRTVSFVTGETLAGPAGSIVIGSAGAIDNPTIGVALWDEEVMNDFRGYPGSVFVDQFRLGFCNFLAIPGGISWSAINSPTDLYPGSNPSDGIFELAPGKVQVYFVVPGPESSEFVFCDTKIYYIPISVTNPLKPGSVAFQLLSGDGSAQVQPKLAQEAILYANAGKNSLMCVIATGAYNRPFNTKNLSDFHQHLFNNIVVIAAPSADTTFNERYAYVLNGDGSIAVGKYDAQSLQSSNVPTIGWGPWSGAGAVQWISAWNADIFFTSLYFNSGVVEALDDSQYVDCALSVNAAPAAFAPPGGKGPLWFIPSQSVTLIDQVTRVMGTYQIDANGFIIPQFNGGENLSISSLVAGQPWTMTVEPFCPDAPPGTSAGQRMFKRRVSRFAAYVVHSTGFVMARLFSGPLTRTSPALGAVMNFTRFPTWNQDDDPTKPPPQREIAERTRPIGRSFDPRVAIIKDTPGPLQIVEIGLEATI